MNAESVALADYRPHIERALSFAGGTHRFEDVAEMVAAGHALLWPGPASCIVTEPISYPRKQILNFWLAGGNLTELMVMAPLILEWGKAKGFAGATLAGRAGWERVLKPYGWTRRDIVVMEHPL